MEEDIEDILREEKEKEEETDEEETDEEDHNKRDENQNSSNQDEGKYQDDKSGAKNQDGDKNQKDSDQDDKSGVKNHHGDVKRDEKSDQDDKILATTEKHRQLREAADKQYRLNAERMKLKYCKAKRKKVLTFSEGDFVSVRIPRIDRTSTDFHRLTCVVVERLGSNFHLYRLRCQHGVLKVCYGEGDLEPFQGGLDLMVKGWQDERVLSLREAAHLLNPQNEFQSSCCNCKTGCTTQRCICQKKGATCSSKCHGGRKCSNCSESADDGDKESADDNESTDDGDNDQPLRRGKKRHGKSNGDKDTNQPQKKKQ